MSMTDTFHSQRRAFGSAIRAATPKVSATFVRTDSVDSIMKPLTQPLDDLDTLIAAKEQAIDRLYADNVKLHQAIDANRQRMKLAEREIAKAYEAQTKLRAVFA
jgi:hypothetical protein